MKLHEDTYAEINNKLLQMEQIKSKLKVLHSHHSNKFPSTSEVVVIKSHDKGQPVSPEFRKHIGDEMLLKNVPFEKICSSYNISIATAKRIKKETIEYYNKVRANPNVPLTKKVNRKGRKSMLT